LESVNRAALRWGPGRAFGCCQWSVTYLFRMTVVGRVGQSVVAETLEVHGDVRKWPARSPRGAWNRASNSLRGRREVGDADDLAPAYPPG